jgi:hypothetical protein
MTKELELRRALASRVAEARARVAATAGDPVQVARIRAAVRAEADTLLHAIDCERAAVGAASLSGAALDAAASREAIERALGELGAHADLDRLNGRAMLTHAHGDEPARPDEFEARARIEIAKRAAADPAALPGAALLAEGHRRAGVAARDRGAGGGA